MKKMLLGLAAIAFLFTSCENDQSESLPDQDSIDMSDFYLYTDADTDEASRVTQDKKSCYTMVNLNRLLNENLGLDKKMYDIELHTRKDINSKNQSGKGKPGGGTGGGGGTIPPTTYPEVTINVVVNILENPNKPVSTSLINSQIAILTTDFQNQNNGTNGIPSEFESAVTDANVTFTLASVVKKTSTKSSWGTNDAMKDPNQGGIAPTDPANYLNIWVCEIGGGILGYAQFPGGSSSTDGIVIGTDYFGENQAGGVYGHGRTATHEVGHYLNLRHIWGDGRCRQDDFVADTPSSDGPNYGCPSYPTVNCKSADMTMNYMDYVYDDCMYMFTNGQNDRMRAIFESGGPRFDLVN